MWAPRTRGWQHPLWHPHLHIQGYALVLAVVLTGASAVSVACGRLIDRVGKARFLLPAVLVYAAGLLLMPLAEDMVPVMGTGLVMMSGFMLVLAPLGALVRDQTRKGRLAASERGFTSAGGPPRPSR